MVNKEVALTYAEEARTFFSDLVKRRGVAAADAQVKALKSEIAEKGYAIVPEFLDHEGCAEMIEVIDGILAVNDKIWVDEQDSDHRIHFANEASPVIDRFFHDDLVVRTLSAYEGTSNHNGFTLANKVVYRDGNRGSGGGWHRDFVKRKQTKALLYLSPVDESTAPFQFIEKSHLFTQIVGLQRRFGFEFNQNRFSDREIADVLDRDPDALATIKGDAGTLILVDTRGIHRGSPIQGGVRYALTNYYWFNAAIPSHIRKLNPFMPESRS